ncbi:hypothetical protein ID866_5547 [Astraeus odoratus]|nr:hypothetical protein ID866_5547 [Astraeus odoratus]
MPSTSGSTSSVDFPSASSEPTSQSSHPSISTSMATPNGKARASLAPPSPVTPKTNGVQGSRIRTTGLSNTPAVPSPLRQAWKSSDSPPQHSQSSRPTRAADFMTELLKEVTPAKKPDVSNPYQTASPVKPPPRKPISKRPRPAPKSAEKPEEKEPELTAQEIIEATVPKARGSKRSRPPPGLEKAPRVEEVSDEEPCTPVNGTLSHSSRLSSSTPSTAEVEEIVVVDKEESPLKKRKTAESPHPSKPSATVEIVDIDAPESTLAPPVIRPSEVIEADEAPKVNGKPSSPAARLSPPAHNPKSAFGVKSSAPKEPSKLRYSYQADKVEVVGSHPAPPLPTSFTPPPAPPAAKLKLSPKEEVLAMDIDELPKYMFTVKETVYPAGPSSESARGAALDVPESSLPTFDIRVIPFKAMDGFNWTAAGMKPPTGATGWKCDLCGLDNAESAKYKCTVCDASRPGAAVPPKPAEVTPPAPPAAPVKAFDWSAAGMAPPPKPGGGGSWTCSLCGLSNPATATDKCPVCDNPR